MGIAKRWCEVVDVVIKSEKYLNYASRHHVSRKILYYIHGGNCNKISLNRTVGLGAAMIAPP
jgi:hypothetical protein